MSTIVGVLAVSCYALRDEPVNVLFCLFHRHELGKSGKALHNPVVIPGCGTRQRDFWRPGMSTDEGAGDGT